MFLAYIFLTLLLSFQTWSQCLLFIHGYMKSSQIQIYYGNQLKNRFIDATGFTVAYIIVCRSLLSFIVELQLNLYITTTIILQGASSLSNLQ